MTNCPAKDGRIGIMDIISLSIYVSVDGSKREGCDW